MPEQGIIVLVVYAVDGSHKTYRLEHRSLTLGRDPSCDITVDDVRASREHARLQWTGSAFEIVDLKSTNGVYVNDRRVERAALQPGDEISLGQHMKAVKAIRVELRNADHIRPADVSSHTSGDSSARAHRIPLAHPEHEHDQSVAIGQLPLADRVVITFGRDPRSRIPLDSPTVSWHHARLDPAPDGGHLLTDLDSKNGTFVNGKRITRLRLKSGMVIRIGPYKFVYQPSGLAGYSEQGSIRIDGIKLHREVPTKTGRKAILNRVSLSVLPREFVALVGGSGAGKSTLLGALSGAKRAQAGQVRVNGEDFYRNYDAYRALMGYVPQEDIIHRELTVESALRYAAQLRLPPDLSEEEITARIKHVLGEVNMLSQRSQSISSLSGGQRKRVSIAAELLGNPSLFFLDEPTSGLDPSLEKKMMLLLRELADRGRTVLLVTHATANIEQCDHVAFMAQGRMVFFGPPAEALRFFDTQDFSDIYEIIERDPAGWEQRYHQSPLYNRYIRRRLRNEATPTPRPAPSSGARVNQSSALRQFVILTQRNLELIRRDRFSLFILLAVMPIIGLLLMLIANSYDLVGEKAAEIERLLVREGRYQVALGSQRVLLMMGLATSLLGVFGAAYEIVKEQAVYARERMINLKIAPYILSKIVTLALFAVLQCASLLVVIALKVRLPTSGTFLPAALEIYITLLITALASICLGLMISAAVQRRDSVIYLVLLVLFVQIIFSGAMFEVKGAMKAVSYITLTRWSVDALGSTVDIPALNDKGKMRIEQEYSKEIEVPDLPKPKTITQTVQMPVQLLDGTLTQAMVQVPRVEFGDPVTTTKTISDTIRADQDLKATLHIPYDHAAGHVRGLWGVLLGFAALFTAATCWLQYRKG